MTSRRAQPFTRCAHARAFTLVELLVAISVLTLIVLVLYGLFDQVQKALRSNVAQVDVLEGGRAAGQLLSGDAEQMVAGNQSASTNLYIDLTALPYQQALLDTNRVNALQELFFLSHTNKSWIGTGYRVLFFDTNGLLMVSNIYPNVTIVTNLVFQGAVTREIRYSFTNSALPSYLEVQWGILEPHVLDRYRSYSDPSVASNYLARQAGAVHLFQQRIPIRSAK